MTTTQDYTNYVVEKCDGEDTVTIVRRKVIYEEKVVSREELKQINERVQKDDDFCLDSIEGMEDIDFEDFTMEEEQYIAFPGDVTSFTDDAIGFMFENQPWGGLYEPVQEAYA